VEEDIVLLSDYLSSWVVWGKNQYANTTCEDMDDLAEMGSKRMSLTCCQLVAVVGQQEGKPDRVDSVRNLIVVYNDNFVAHIRVDCMRRSHWHMAAAGKVQNPLQARSTTFQPSGDF
jgi:hypothetical protein